jgi:hypothetical protein
MKELKKNLQIDIGIKYNILAFEWHSSKQTVGTNIQKTVTAFVWL